MYSKKDLKKANEWYHQTDFVTLERISGLKEDDFDPADGSQDFVDACDLWWENLSDQEKVSIYEQNR